MKNKKIIFWAVDCQKDFINPDGALYVEGAESIKPNLKKLTKFAKDNNIMVVNTRDYHWMDDEELSDKPDFVNTFPNHCIRKSDGANFIEETDPGYYYNELDEENPVLINLDLRNIVINKTKFDVFTGNSNTDKYVKLINPDIVVVYGVAGDYCVKYAVDGLIKKGCQVMVVLDSIKAIKANPIMEWEALGVQIRKTEEIFQFVKESKNEK